MVNRSFVGIAGAVFLAVGVLCPIISMPVQGHINLFANGRGDGVIILIIALFGLLFSANKSYSVSSAIGLIALGFVGYKFCDFLRILSSIKTDMNTQLTGNPFRGLADAMVGGIQLQWGWIPLFLGGVMLLSVAFIKEAKVDATQQHNQASEPDRSLDERLKKLNDLKDQGLIKDDEYQSRRTEILQEV